MLTIRNADGTRTRIFKDDTELVAYMERVYNSCYDITELNAKIIALADEGCFVYGHRLTPTDLHLCL